MPASRKKHTNYSRRTGRVSNRIHRILCVDDDEDLTRIIKARLQRFPVEVIRASNGREALQLVKSQRPAVVITDLQMHRGDGEYLLRKLKSRASTKAIPVLVISGIADQRRKAQAQMMGASSVLCKPVRFEVLLDALSQHLDLENPGDEDEPKAHIRLKNKVLRIDGNHQRMEPNFNGGLEPQ